MPNHNRGDQILHMGRRCNLEMSRTSGICFTKRISASKWLAQEQTAKTSCNWMVDLSRSICPHCSETKYPVIHATKAWDPARNPLFPPNIPISELQKFQFRVGDPLNFEPGSLVLHPHPDFYVVCTLPIETRRETLVWRSCYKDLTLRKSMCSNFATAMWPDEQRYSKILINTKYCYLTTNIKTKARQYQDTWGILETQVATNAEGGRKKRHRKSSTIKKRRAIM
jgi:hypothetical protein